MCGGVGSGKSRTSLAYFYFKVCKGSLKLYKTSKNNLEKIEILKKFKKAKNQKKLYIITTAKKRDEKEWEGEAVPFLFEKNDISMIVDSWNNIGKYSEVENSFFIFDEQRVIGSGAWVKAFLKIAKKNDWILLSATPGDTWMDYIPVFIANGFYKNRTEFLRTHVIYSRYVKFPKVDRYLATGRLLKYRNSILVDMDYQKETIPHNEKIFAPYDERMTKFVMRYRWDPFDDEPIQSVSKYFYILRKIVNTSKDRQEIVKKLIRENKKVIIFYNFNYERDILRDIGKDLNIMFAEWNGSKHQPIPTGEEWLYLVQYNSGSEGWNCTSTNVMIFYSQSYSYRMMIQASGRIDRVNTPYKDLYYYHILSKSRIDREISAALNKKRKFNETNSSIGKEFNKAMIGGPCLDCSKRSPECHSTCKAYLEYVAANKNEQEKIKSEKQVEDADVYLYYSNRTRSRK